MEQPTGSSIEDFLQKAYATCENLPGFDLKSLLETPYTSPQDIDRIVEDTTQLLQETYTHNEEEYVEQMLLHNPIVIEKRSNTADKSDTEDMVDIVTVPESTKRGIDVFLQRQRAESCRRSRYNNKVKKAKMEYRHQYISQRLLRSTYLVNCLQKLINQAEKHLIVRGMPLNRIENMRKYYGVDNIFSSDCT